MSIGYVQCLFDTGEHLNNLMNSGDFSDLTLKCQGVEFKVHKCIMAQSEFFHTALKSGFSEAETGIMDMSEDEPHAISAIIQCVYGRQYNTPARTHLYQVANDHADIYAAAEKYVLPRLKQLALTSYGSTLNQMTMQMYEPGFETVVASAYDGTGDHDQALKHRLVAYVANKGDNPTIMSAANRDSCDEILAEWPDFAADLRRLGGDVWAAYLNV